MKLSTGLNVLVGRGLQPAQVMSNGFTVNFTRSHERYKARIEAEHGRKMHPDMAREIKEIEDTGITRSGFHKFPGEQTRKPGYAQVLINGKELAVVQTKKLQPA